MMINAFSNHITQIFGYIELPWQLNVLYRQSLGLCGSIFADDHSCESLWWCVDVSGSELSNLLLIPNKINPIMIKEIMLIKKASSSTLDIEPHIITIAIYDNTYKSIDFFLYVFSKIIGSFSSKSLSNLANILAYRVVKNITLINEASRAINTAKNKSLSRKLIVTIKEYGIANIIKVDFFLACLILFLNSLIIIINNSNKEII